jgi:hypothetical protein
MQTSTFGKSKGLRETLTEGTWMEAFDGLDISIILTCNPSIQVLNLTRLFYNEHFRTSYCPFALGCPTISFFI